MYTLTCFENDPLTFLSLEIAHSAEGLNHSKPSLVFFRQLLEPIVIGHTDCSSVINPLANRGFCIEVCVETQTPSSYSSAENEGILLVFYFLESTEDDQERSPAGFVCIGVFLQLNCKSVLTCFDL
jgi:hypothetical protein